MVMICKIADLSVQIPVAGDMPERCKEYLINQDSADIIIRAELYNLEKWSHLSNEMAVYLESGRQFYASLLQNNGLYLHSSAVEMDGKAYLFSGPSGMGKSTHTRLWQQVFGESAQVFNDDKPALRRMEDGWYAYGTPWCGKDGINQNKKVPLGGICFLRRGKENSICRLDPLEASTYIISQTIHKFTDTKDLDLMLSHVEKLVSEIPVYEFFNKPEPEAVRLSHDVMSRGAQEVGI